MSFGRSGSARSFQPFEGDTGIGGWLDLWGSLGDLDGDGCVGPSDLGILLSLWDATSPICGDLDGDGEIRAGDLGILLSNWDGCP